MDRLSLNDLNVMPRDEVVAALENIYEHSPWVAEAAADARPFASVAALYAALQSAVARAGDDRRMTLIRSHPDLSGRTQRASPLTSDSQAEQTGLGLDRLNEDEFAAFTRVNAAYREKFGIPYIACVRRHTKDSILQDFQARITNDQATEMARALEEIDLIAALRLDQLVSGEAGLPVHGRLSTHVLDTHRGRPAAGVALELTELSSLGVPRLIARATTNHDGRTDRPLIGGRPVPRGTYQLTFAVGDYFRLLGVPMSEPPFLDIVPLRFSVADPEGHLHVPLLVTPWSYATYRGS